MKASNVIAFLAASILWMGPALQGVTAAGLAMSKSVKVGSLEMSPIGFGSWAWGNEFLWGYDKAQDPELKRTFEFIAGEQRGLWIDTAEVYGKEHRSEELIGSFSRSLRDKAPSPSPPLILTKFAPKPFSIGSESIISAARGSAQRLRDNQANNNNVKSIDLLQLHWPPSPFLWQEEAYLDGMCQLVKNKEVKQIGVSNYGPAGLKRVAVTVEGFGGKIYSDQVQCSLLYQNMLDLGLVEACRELGIQPLAYSPLALGLLTDKYSMDKLPSGPRSLLFREYLPKISKLLAVLRAIAKERSKTVTQVVLNWVMAKGFLALVGVRTVFQVQENLGSCGWTLTNAEIEEIDRASKSSPKFVKNPQECD